jgi:hypothetical protein
MTIDEMSRPISKVAVESSKKVPEILHIFGHAGVALNVSGPATA